MKYGRRRGLGEEELVLRAWPLRPDDELDRVSDLMQSEQVRRIPVVDGDRLVVIIAQAEVAREGRDKKTGDVVEHISEPSRGR